MSRYVGAVLQLDGVSVHVRVSMRVRVRGHRDFLLASLDFMQGKSLAARLGRSLDGRGSEQTRTRMLYFRRERTTQTRRGRGRRLVLRSRS